MESELFTRRRALQLLTATALAPFVPGCARAPTSSTGTVATKLIGVTMQTSGAIQQASQNGGNFYYFTVFNLTDSPTDPGPVYVPSPPYGFNGFAAPAQATNSSGGRAQGFVGFVLYCPPINGTASGYELYNVPYVNANDTTQGLQDVTTLGLSSFLPQGQPDTAISLVQGADVLFYRLALNRLPGYNRKDSTGAARTPPRYLQVNFITTDNLPQNPNSPPERKDWDALGEYLQNASNSPYLVIDLTQNATYQNSDYVSNTAVHEVPGDVFDVNGRTVNVPELDIVDWSIQVTST